jgi:AcrR family transcriptional regulator
MERGGLNRERILGAALQLADEQGIESLSMRRLAQRLGVEAMSLYHYFPNKQALQDAMLDAVFGEMALPVTSGDWQSDLRACAVSAKDVLMSHEWAAGLVMKPAGTPSQARFVWMNSVLGRLREAGFSPNMTHHAYHALDSHIIGFVLWALPYVALERADPDFAARFLETFVLPWDTLPHLAEHIQEHADDRPGDTSEFDFGLDLLLKGLDDVRSSAA